MCILFGIKLSQLTEGHLWKVNSQWICIKTCKKYVFYIDKNIYRYCEINLTYESAEI